MKKIFLCFIVFSTFCVAWARNDSLSAEGYASNKKIVEEILAMENAIGFIGTTTNRVYGTVFRNTPESLYCVLFKDENLQYRIESFSSRTFNKELKSFENLIPQLPSEKEEQTHVHPISSQEADIVLRTLASQIALSKENLDNNNPIKPRNVYEIGLKTGDTWDFAGLKGVLEDLDELSIAFKLSHLKIVYLRDRLRGSINSIAYDYKTLAKETLQGILIDLNAEPNRRYFSIMEFDKDKCIDKFILSTKDEIFHLKIRTLKHILSIDNSRKAFISKLEKETLFPKTNRSPQKEGNNLILVSKKIEDGKHSFYSIKKDNIYDEGESFYYIDEKRNSATESLSRFTTSLMLKAEESWEWKENPKQNSTDPANCVIYEKLESSWTDMFSRGIYKMKNAIDAIVNPPIGRFKGQSNGEFAECFGIATFKDDTIIDFWSIHLRTEHSSAMTIEDDKTMNVEIDFDFKKRKYLNLTFSMENSTELYLSNGIQYNILDFRFKDKAMKKRIEILKTFKSEDTIKVIFSAKIIP